MVENYFLEILIHGNFLIGSLPLKSGNHVPMLLETILPCCQTVHANLFFFQPLISLEEFLQLLIGRNLQVNFQLVGFTR